MDIRMGTMPVPGLPSTIPVTKGVNLIVERGGRNDSITLRDDAQDVSVELADIVRDIVWCSNLDVGTLVIGSEYGRRLYIVEGRDLRIRRELSVFRSDEALWNRLGIVPTPDGTRVVVLSDTLIHLLSWQGEVLLEQPIQVNYSFVALDDVSIVLRDEGDVTAKLLTYPLPK
jgi:hypothetical protein